MTIQKVDFATHLDLIGSIRRAYDSRITRWYIFARFRIIHINILDLLDRLVPPAGPILDLGCGFGLFSIYLALRNPSRSILGIDLSEKRIQMARRAAQKLGVQNVGFRGADITTFPYTEKWNGIYCLDILHHITPPARESLLNTFPKILSPEGILIIKDVATKPLWKMAFTWLLDQLVAGPCRVWYQSAEAQAREIHQAGFEVQYDYIRDLLPYPHVIFRCKKEANGAADRPRNPCLSQ